MKLRQGNVFTPVCHSIHRDVCVSATPLGQTPPVHAGIHTHPLPSACWDTHTPLPSACWDTHTPPAQCMLGYTPPCPVHAGIHTPPAQCMLGYGQQAGCTHPTGMYSCRNNVSAFKILFECVKCLKTLNT